jgi:hypothetical protein
MAISGWPSNVRWNQFRTLQSRPTGETTDAHIEGEYANPPGKQFQPKQGKDGWRLENVNFVMKLTPSKTWYVRGKETKEMLKHEQGHWDILGLLVRELQTDIESIRTKAPADLAGSVQTVQARIDKKSKLIGGKTGRYDRETDHHRNRTRQATWDKLIASCISSGRNLPDR